MEKENNLALSDFQSWMQHQLLDPTGAQKGNESTAIELLVNDSKRLSAKDHLAIYQRSYIARLRDCMTKVFTALEYALGPDLFEAFADLYLEENPSSSYNLSNLGEKFADFLAATRPDLHDEVKEDWPDFMIELARFEFAITDLFDREDTSNSPFATMDTMDENLRLRVLLKLFEFSFPIRPYYSAFANGETPILPNLEQSYCAIVRQEPSFRIALYDLQNSQYQFLTHFQSHGSIHEAKKHLIAEFGVDAEELNSMWGIWKNVWINAGFLEDRSLRR